MVSQRRIPLPVRRGRPPTKGDVAPPPAAAVAAPQWVRWRVLSDGRVARGSAVPEFLLRGPVSREGYVIAGSPEEADQRAAAMAEAAARRA